MPEEHHLQGRQVATIGFYLPPRTSIIHYTAWLKGGPPCIRKAVTILVWSTALTYLEGAKGAYWSW